MDKLSQLELIIKIVSLTRSNAAIIPACQIINEKVKFFSNITSTSFTAIKQLCHIPPTSFKTSIVPTKECIILTKLFKFVNVIVWSMYIKV